MNAKHLLTLYDRVVDAPDAIFRLRQFVLDLAVRGKLVEQNPEDEPASELLKRIAAAKNTIIKERRIRRRKILPALKVDPFPIPENWYWTRIREIASDREQKIPDKPFTYIDVSAIDKENGLVSPPRVLEADKAPSRARKVAHQGDVIYSCVRPYLLNVAVIEDDFNPPPIVSTAFEILNGHGLVLPRYIWIVLRSPFIIKCVEENQRGQAYPAIKSTDFALLPFPLPPLAEQHRIVDKVDELFTLCDQLEESRATREKTRDRLAKATLTRISTPDTNVAIFRAHARFAIDALPALTTHMDQIKDLRQTILDLAVHGKLVEQSPADEPASVSSEMVVQKGINNSQLPRNWCRTNVGDILVFRYGKGLKANDRVDDGPVPIYGSNGILGYTAEPLTAHPSIIVGRKGSAGSLNKCNGPSWTTDVAYYIETPDFFDIEFLFHSLVTLRLSNLAKGVKPGLSRIDAYSQSISVPPLAEQHRIVKKVDELFILCDKLEEACRAREVSRVHLLEILLHDALVSSANEPT